jgi:hypothetical protein
LWLARLARFAGFLRFTTFTRLFRLAGFAGVTSLAFFHWLASVTSFTRFALTFLLRFVEATFEILLLLRRQLTNPLLYCPDAGLLLGWQRTKCFVPSPQFVPLLGRQAAPDLETLANFGTLLFVHRQPA